MTAEPSRNLVLVHSAGWQDVADFHAIKLRVEKTAPDIEVFVASNDIRSSLTRKRAAERPTLVFSPIRLLAFRPARGKVYAGRRISMRSVQIRNCWRRTTGPMSSSSRASNWPRGGKASSCAEPLTSVIVRRKIIRRTILDGAAR